MKWRCKCFYAHQSALSRAIDMSACSFLSWLVLIHQDSWLRIQGAKATPMSMGRSRIPLSHRQQRSAAGTSLTARWLTGQAESPHGVAAEWAVDCPPDLRWASLSPPPLPIPLNLPTLTSNIRSPPPHFPPSTRISAHTAQLTRTRTHSTRTHTRTRTRTSAWPSFARSQTQFNF